VQVDGASIDFTDIEAESSFVLRAVTRRGASGADRIVAYVLELTITVPNNKYIDRQADFQLLQPGTIADLDISFNRFTDSAPNQSMKIDAGISGSVPAKTGTLLTLTCSGWTIEQVERRLRMRVSFKAIYSVRLFEATVMPHFIQYL
jgi:hypothetical protein